MPFACDVAQKLQENARELSKQTGITAFCSHLEGSLANVRQYLEDLGEEPGNAVGQLRLVKLLDNLERLCQVSFPIPRNRTVTVDNDSVACPFECLVTSKQYV